MGDNNSGKTRFINQILCSEYEYKGKVDFRGLVSYVSQKRWIQEEMSLRENILFGKPYVKEFYEKVIKTAELHNTNLNELKQNFSEGEKARISIARCLYSQSDVLIFDEFLSNLDFRTADNILINLFEPNGMLKDKTVIFVTTSLKILEKSSQIIVFKEGQVEMQGSYKQLKSNDYFKHLTCNQRDIEKKIEKLENGKKIKLHKNF